MDTNISMEQLSEEVVEKMRKAGFTNKRIQFHQLLAQVYEEILNKQESLTEELIDSLLVSLSNEELLVYHTEIIQFYSNITDSEREKLSKLPIEKIRDHYTSKTEYVYYICGSFAEAFGCNLSQHAGQLSPKSDLDTTFIDKLSKPYHFEDCECGEAVERHLIATETAAGHYTLAGCSASYLSPANSIPAQSCKAQQDFVYAVQAACLPKQSVYKTGTFTKYGVHLVRASRPGHKGTEWRISYSLFERQIFYKMDPIIGLVFVILKYIIKKKLNDYGLRSYHAKTLAFYLFQKNNDCEFKEYELLKLVKEALQILIDDILTIPDEKGLLHHALHSDGIVYSKETQFPKDELVKMLESYIVDIETVVNEFTNQLVELTNNNIYFAQPFSYLIFLYSHLDYFIKMRDEIMRCLSVNEVVLLQDKVFFYLRYLSELSKNSADWNYESFNAMLEQLFADCPFESSAYAIKLILKIITAEWVGDSDTSKELLITSLSSIQFKHLQVCNGTDSEIKNHIWNQFENSHSLWLFSVNENSLNVLPVLFQDLQYKANNCPLTVINLRAVLNVYKCQFLSQDKHKYSPETWITELQTDSFYDWQDIYAFAKTTTNLEHLKWSFIELKKLADTDLDKKLTQKLEKQISTIQKPTFKTF